MLKLDFVKNSCGFCDVYITGDEPLTYGDVVLSSINEDKDGEVFIRATNVEGIFKYGCKLLKDDIFGNRAGYVWSSRVGVLNKMFDVALMECCYRASDKSTYECCAIDLAHLEEILKDTEYEINYTPQLHFEVRAGKKAVNPRKYLP